MNQPAHEPLAIVGIGCRMPGGITDPESFWDLLISGKSGIVETPKDRWDTGRYYHPDTAVPVKMHTKWGGFVDNVDRFDAAFFGISPREAQRMDPQQRWLLETAWEALEDAGIPPKSLRGTRTGVYVGIASNEYGSIQMMGEEDIDMHTNSGSTLSIASNRISYLLDLKGPSMSVDTACSSALVAINLACKSLWSGECDTVLAGGVNALLMPDASIGFSKATMLSPSGQCFAFDERANGYVRGEGAGMIAVKRLADAQRDGDRIYATIRATVINQDGNTSSMTVPGEDSQADMLEEAYAQAGMEPSRVGYMEAHGTGTPVGDPIETRALGRVLCRGRAVGEECIIGSVKSNIGHLESASGIAGLIKAALVLHHKTIPPNLNYERPNPHIPFEELKLRVPVEAESLPRFDGKPGVTAVNSFGFGGANAHVVLEESPECAKAAAAPGKDADRPFVLPISAHGESPLRANAKAIRDFLKDTSVPLDAVCYSAATHKDHLDDRLVVVADSRRAMRDRIREWLSNPAHSEGVFSGRPGVANGEPVFVFTGQGAQWWAMGQQLLKTEPVFRKAIEDIDALLKPLAGWSLVEEMTRDEESSKINQTNIAQPAIFALQVALAALWKSWGVQPAKVVGHSVGEVAAAHVAGIYSLEDAVTVIYHRSRLQDTTGGHGRMAAVGVSPAEARDIVRGHEDRVQLAVINSPSMVTLAGDTEALEPIVEKLEEGSTFVRWLRIDYAFHTHQMDPIREELLEALAGIRPTASEIPYISTVTGGELPGEKLDAGYWWQNVRESVLFAPAMAHLIKGGSELFLELGPHPALQSSINECLSEQGRKGVVLHSLKRKSDEPLSMLENLAGLHFQDVGIDWAAVNQCARSFVRLPSYPWNREKYWLECERSREHRLGKFDHPMLGVRQPFPEPTWEFRLDPRFFTYLNDHRFWDSIVFPAAGYGEIGLAVARTLFPDEPWVVEDLETTKALFVSEQKVPFVRVVYREDTKAYEVFSRIGEGEWELNGKGTLRKLTDREPEPANLESVRAGLPDHYDHERYYDEYAKAGYQFGPNFQQVQNVWRRQDESLAEIVVPEHVCETVADYHFHPAVLDACFHAVKGAQVIPENAKASDYFYLPAGIRRIRLYTDKLPTHLWSHARLTLNDGETALADIEVFDNDGRRVAEILGFRADRVDQKDEETESVDNSFYQFRWEPKRLPGSRVSEPLNFTPNTEIAASANAHARAVFEKYQLGPYLGEYAPGSRSLVGHVIENAYLSLGWKPEVGDEVVYEPFMAELGIVPDHRRLVHAQLRAMEDDGILRRKEGAEDTWIVERMPEQHDVLAELEAMKEKWPACIAELILYEMTGPNLADVLSGEVDPLELLFPGGSSEALERFYIEGADFLPNNELMSAAVAKAAENLSERRALRVLEIGAGTGSLTKAVLPLLPAGRTEFTFTDNGPAFLNEAKKQFADYDFVEYRIFDIEKPPEDQNIDVAGYDLILATNVLHATKDLKNTLANLKSCLSRDGLLLFLEVSRDRAELDMIFGLLKGWWHFTDTDLRVRSPLLAPARWKALLEECGFEDVETFDAIPDDSDLPPGQTAFCARISEVATASAEEEARPKIHQMGSLLDVESVPMAEADIIVHSLCLESGDDLVAAQDNGVLSLHALTVELHEAAFEDAPRVFVITRGAQSVAGEPVAALHAAPTTGFLRVARGEHPEYNWTQIDLDPETDAHEIEDVLEELFLEDDGEREIAYRGGCRHGLRIYQKKAEELPVRTRNAVSENGIAQYRLQISTPGVLANLSLNETSRRDPGPDEIEIQVKAGGINFRDVMKALGMYPGNPVDLRWFGDDFSGTVVRAGENVTDVQPGDQVTGMAPYCFRAYVTVNRHMVFKKPAHITHLQAATLPTVFLTTHYALNELARLQPGEKVLVHAGTGGVGQAAIQIAKDIGVEIFATAGTREKRWLLKEMGVDHVMDSRSLDFADEIMEITGGVGVDVVLNSLAGDFIPKSFSVLAPFGRFLEIGKIDIYGNSKLGLASLKDNISYFVIDLAQHLEHRPAYVAGMLDEIRRKLDAKAYQPLPHEVFPVTDVVEAFRFMAQGKHIGKNVLDFDVDDIQIAPSTNPDEFFKPDATYLVTGGAGGFGWELSKWMIGHGARHLCLMSRSGPNEEVQAEFEALRADGVTIIDARGDVTSADDIDRIVSDIGENHPPLRGVIHGAMVLDDDFIIELDRERFNKVHHPKMLGAWNLHNATLGCELDHFIGFSSFSSVIGAIKQSNYNAGNYFLEALADHRHALGLPALTINWGALTGAGFVDRNEKTLAYLEALGMKAYTMEETQYVMEQILPRDPVRLAASRIEWQQLMKLSPALKANPTYAIVSRKEGGDEGGSIRPQILGAPAEERLGILEDFIAEQVAGVFGTDVAKVDRDTPLTNIGLDSLMAIELINRIESALAMSVPMSSVLNGPNIKELCVPILDLLEQSGDGDAGAADGATAESGAVARSGGPDKFPLSEGQRALWFLHQLDPKSPAYNLVLSAKLKPAADIELMQRAFASLFERHPMLDVTFSVEDGQPVQTLRKGGTIDFREHDATQRSEQEIQSMVVDKAIQPFDLEHGPVMRVDLFRTSDNAHVVLFSMHHIISDAWSVGMLFNDLIECYFSLRAGREPNYPPLDHHYSDFVAWEQKELNGSSGEALRSYWTRELSGAPTVLDLSTDHPRPAVQTFNGATHGFKLGESLTRRIGNLATAQTATLYNTLLSAFNALLHRYSGQDDIIIGSPMAGRLQSEFRGIVGYFVNPVPIRSRIDDDPTFVEFLRRNVETVNRAIEYQNYPMVRIVDDLKLPRDPSRSPLFQTAFAMEQTPGSDDRGIAAFLIGQGGHQFGVGDFTIETFDLSLRQAQFEISLVVQEAGGSLYGCWQYNSDLFDPETIGRFSRLFEQVLDEIVANPEMKISDISLLGEEEQSMILGTWNDTDADYPREKPVPQLIAEQAAVTPDAPAVTYGQTTLTYAELEARANGLAMTLRAEGVVPDEPVAVLATRSADMVVGMLGVLKAGGCYVPMDPTYPSFRIEQMLEDAKPRVLLTERGLAKEVPAGDWATVCLDDVRPADVVTSGEELAPDSLAYIIYTSGSTGTPKGVEIPHSAVVNFLTSMRRRPGLTRVDKLLAVTTISFDISVLEIFLPLVAGGHLVIAGEEDTHDGRRLSALLEEHDISIMQATPATWRMLLDSGWEGKNGLRILCGGEALPRDLANLLVNSADEVWNLYGPTETTIWSTSEKIDESNEPVSIGKPIDNTQVYILDKSLHPVPVGFVGDLYIGGDGLSLGYHGQPDLTSESFVDVALPGGKARLYKTGDLARWHRDGKIECLGRSDSQIKLRGVRIELGEIEAQLASHPSVEQAVVIKRDDLPGGEALVAYIIGDDDTADLRAHLADRLPEAMRPSYYLVVEAFPMTPNRKIDRKNLPSPAFDREGLGSEHLAPQTTSERVLWEIFNEAFAPREVGIRDNFFELGGDSLMAVRIVTQVSASFNREVPVAAFLTHPTIEQLARYLHNEPGTGSADAPLAARGEFDHDYLTVEIGAETSPPIDAAALACIPDAFLPLTGLDRAELAHGWFGNAPRLTNRYDTPLGRIGLVMLPCFELDLYKDPASVKDITLDALRLAAGAGARNVSLTGVIPSATNHGLDISAWINGSTDLPIITTGDATRTATVVLSMEGILAEAQRDFGEESVAIIGLGSIGRGTLELMLEVLPHPKEITLCDFYGEDERLDGIRDQLLAGGFEGDIRIARANGRLPAEVYEATFVIGATSVPGIIDVNKLRAGALLVDYSFPPAFRPLDAAQRLEEQGDLLFTTGGQLKLGTEIPETIYLPTNVESLVEDLDPARLHALAGREASEITGCVLASLVTGQTPDVRVTLGEVKPEDCLAHYSYLKSLPATPARLQIESYTISDEAIARFRGETPSSPVTAS